MLCKNYFYDCRNTNKKPRMVKGKNYTFDLCKRLISSLLFPESYR